MARHMGSSAAIRTTLDLDDALDGADFVVDGGITGAYVTPE